MEGEGGGMREGVEKGKGRESGRGWVSKLMGSVIYRTTHC